MSKIIRILRSGKNTQTRLRFDKGLPEHTLERVGAGRFLPGEFADLSVAKASAESEVKKDPSAVLFIVSENQILDEVIDLEYQNRRDKRDRRIYAVVTSAVIFTISLGVSLLFMPFTSIHGHVLFIGGMTLLYIAAMIVFGTRSIHALLLFGIILLLVLFLTPAIQELLDNPKIPQNTGTNAAPPQR